MPTCWCTEVQEGSDALMQYTHVDAVLMQCSFTGKCGQWCSDAIFMLLPQKATVGSWLEMRLHHWDNEGHVDVVDVDGSIGDDRVQNLTTPITIMMMIRRMTSWGIFSQVPQLPWMSSWVGWGTWLPYPSLLSDWMKISNKRMNSCVSSKCVRY